MALFTKRDRIAIACIGALILTGWGIRLFIHRSVEHDEIKIIRNAVKLPPALMSEDSLAVTLVNINTADEKTLDTLPMIGPAKASAITAYRKEHGPFTETSDIMNVKGIGPGIYEKIKNFITVNSHELSKEPRKKTTQP